MHRQQSQVSASTLYRFTHHNRKQELGAYIKFKNEHENTLSSSKIEELKKIYPHGILGRNLQGHVVILDRVGVIKSQEIGKIVDDEVLISYIMQRLIFLSEHVLGQKERVVWVIDLAGKIMQLASKKTYTIMQKVVTNANRYFPGLLHKLYFINTPMLFDTIWSKISQSVDQHTLQKIVHLGDELEEMYVDVGLDLLPEYLGGGVANQVLDRLDRIQAAGDQQKQGKGLYRGQQKSQSSNQEQQIDFSSLKMALSGLKLGGSHNNQSVAQTPLNTEADDAK